jgi:hypothetical protein
LGCYDKNTTDWVDFPQHWKLEIWGQGASKVRFLMKALFLIYRPPSSPCILTFQKGRNRLRERDWETEQEWYFSFISFYKGINTIHESSTFMNQLSPKASTSYSYPLEVGVSMRIFGWHKYAVHSNLTNSCFRHE